MWILDMVGCVLGVVSCSDMNVVFFVLRLGITWFHCDIFDKLLPLRYFDYYVTCVLR